MNDFEDFKLIINELIDEAVKKNIITEFVYGAKHIKGIHSFGRYDEVVRCREVVLTLLKDLENNYYNGG